MDFVSGFASGDPIPSFIDAETVKILWLVMAALFLVDAVIYWLAWYNYARKEANFKSEPIFFEARAFGEIYNVVSSVGWVVVAALAYSISSESSRADKISYWVKYAVATLFSSVLMFESTLHWLSGWRTERNQDLKLRQRWKAQGPCSFVAELGFWAEFLDCLGSVLYMIGSFVLIFNFFSLISTLPIGSLASQVLSPIAPELSSPMFEGSPYPNETDISPQSMETEFDASFTSTDALACKLFFFGDLTYALDAILYIILWYRYHKSDIDMLDIDLSLNPGENYFPLEDNLERLAVPLKAK